MRRIAASMFLALAWGSFPASPALAGGGGCSAPVTQGVASLVRIQRFCFKPTILYADPGDSITWVNRDEAAHLVLGANLRWGNYRDLELGESDVLRFSSPGVYPYLCTYHPGMVGAVVVGDVRAPAAGEEGRIDASSVSLVGSTDTGAAPGERRTEQASGSGSWKAVAVAAAALLLLTVAGTAERARTAERRRRG
jgi:plastocyanin